MDVQAVIVPGVGVAACQAGVDNTRENQMLVYNEIKKGTPPPQILEMLKKDPEQSSGGSSASSRSRTARRSRAQNNRAGFNGTGNSRSSLYFGGQVGDIFYQVQGNTLLGDAGGAPGRARLHARDRHAGRSRDGGDGSGRRQRRRHRCNCGNNPLDFVPCDNKTAHVAYIAIAKKDDQVGVTHNDGKYFAYISVTDDNIKKGESANPVKTLRMRYNAWVRSARTRLPSQEQRLPAEELRNS